MSEVKVSFFFPTADKVKSSLARAPVQEREEARSDRAEDLRQKQAQRTERQQEARAQDRAEQAQRREATQEAQREENNRGQNLQVEQEQGRGQAVDTVA